MTDEEFLFPKKNENIIGSDDGIYFRSKSHMSTLIKKKPTKRRIYFRSMTKTILIQRNRYKVRLIKGKKFSSDSSNQLSYYIYS